MKRFFIIFLFVLLAALPAFSQTTTEEANYTVYDLYNQYKWFWDSLVWAAPSFAILLFLVYRTILSYIPRSFWESDPLLEDVEQDPRVLDEECRGVNAPDKKIYHGKIII